jgi:predicted 3-demethylubiquinone-9 3-methyltransferase (glyoxalase superfamily)
MPSLREIGWNPSVDLSHQPSAAPEMEIKHTPRGDTPMNKVTPFLMFNDQLEAAIEFYIATFPNSEVRNVASTDKDGPISSAEFVVGGQLFMGYNGGAYFSFSEGVSLYVDCADQDEVDEYWDKLVKAGAEPTQCGWIKDPFGEAEVRTSVVA